MSEQFKKVVSILLSAMVAVTMNLFYPQPVSASPQSIVGEIQQPIQEIAFNVDWQQLQQSAPNIDWQQLQKSVPNIDWQQLQNSATNIDWQQLQKSVPNIDWQQLQQSATNIDWQQLQKSVPNIDWQQLQQSASNIDWQQVQNFVPNIDWQQLQESLSDELQQIGAQIDLEQIKKGLTDKETYQKVGQVIANTNQKLVANATLYLATSPDQLCQVYNAHIRGIDNSGWEALNSAAESTFTVFKAVSSASTAGAGALSGYAGIASTVSQLGLGSLTTSVAGMLGSSATGAAATSVVTSFVGGPLIMAALLVGGTSVAAWGGYKAVEFTAQNFAGLVEDFCVP